jgi:hypothetical protein
MKPTNFKQTCKYNKIMTTKEKAKELFNKFCYAIGTDRTDSGYYTNIIYAKQCALIAVDEILWEIIKYSDNSKGFVFENSIYWQDVKKELTNL